MLTKQNKQVNLPSCAVVLLIAALHQFHQTAYPRGIGHEHLSTGLFDNDGFYWTAVHAWREVDGVNLDVIELEKKKLNNQTGSPYERTAFVFDMADLLTMKLVAKQVVESKQLTLGDEPESAPTKKPRAKKPVPEPIDTTSRTNPEQPGV